MVTHNVVSRRAGRLPAIFTASLLMTLGLLAAGNALAADSPETVLYSFRGTSDGQQPQAALIADQAGNLYGTTLGAGGLCGPGQCGSVFELTRPNTPGGAWTERTLYSFSGGNDGAGSLGSLAMDTAGNLYGTSIYGSSRQDVGTIFELTRPITPGGAWTWSLLYAFKPDNINGYGDGNDPYSGVIVGPDGALYGTTRVGGRFGQGTVYKLAPPSAPGGVWSEHILYSFRPLNRGDGNNPEAGLVFDQAGNLYGTTYQGGIYFCGTVFELTPPAPPHVAWTERVLTSFNGDGNSCTEYNPLSTPVLDKEGNLYGTTEYSGGFMGYGTVFRLQRPTTGSGVWTETDLYHFPQYPYDAFVPVSGVIIDKSGNLYGTTQNGGSPAYGGAVYKLAPPSTRGGAWTEHVLYAFKGGNDGEYPDASPIFGPDGLLYGTTSEGGSGPCSNGSTHLGCGTVFSVAP